MKELDATALLKRCDRSFSSEERTNAETIWDLISEFILPNQHGQFSGIQPKGAKRTRRLFDSTAIYANHDLASSMHFALTNPATRWAKGAYEQRQLNDNDEASAWLEDSVNRVYAAWGSSNLNNELPKYYKAICAFGTASLNIEEIDPTSPTFSGFNFKTWHLSEIAIQDNNQGLVDTLYRKFKLSARNAFDKWNTSLPDDILKDVEENPDKEHDFIQVIYPRDKKDVKLTPSGEAPPKKRPYASIYISRKGPEILEEGGYYDFPAPTGRWETAPTEVYGRSPAYHALPDIRTLNKVQELGLESLAKAIKPPIVAEESAIISSLHMGAGGLNIVKRIEGLKEFGTQARFDVAQFQTEELKKSIKSAFFLDKLFLPDRRETGEMTAFEISVRRQQLQQVIGPTVGRVDYELLGPLFKRCFYMMLRKGAFKPIPEIAKGSSIRIEYINSLTRSQKIEDVTAIQQWLQEIGMLAQLDPTVVDNANVDEIAKLIAERRGVPEIVLRSSKEIEGMRQQRQQQMEQQQAVDQGIGVADIISKTGLNGGNNAE